MIFQLAENTSKRVQVAKVGKFQHEIYGNFSITLDDLQKMKLGLDENIRRQELEGKPVLPFDYKHEEEDIAAGWITSLEIDKDKNGANALFAEVDWTPKAAEKIKTKEFKFVSPSIRRNYQDAETGKKFDIILKGATLTNVPFLRDMEAVHLLSESRRAAFESLKLSGDEPDINFKKGVNMPKKLAESFSKMSPDDQKEFLLACGLMKKDKKLSEELRKTQDDLRKAQSDLKLSEDQNKKLTEEMSNSTDASDKLKLAEGKIEKLEENLKSMTREMADAKRKAQFDQMLSEGKVCEAQRKPFMAQDFAEYAKLNEPIKLRDAGQNYQSDEDMSQEKASGELLKLAEEKAKADECEFGEAMKLVLSENPKLAAQAGQ